MTERFLDMNSPARPRPYVGTPGGSPLAELQSRASTGSLHASPDTVAPPAEGASADAPLTPMVKPAREEISLALWSSGATPGSLRALGRASSAGASVSTQGGRAHAVGGRVAAVDTPSFHGDRVEVLPSSADRSADPDGPGRTPPHERASAAPAAARRRPQSTAAIVESESDDESVAKELFFRTLEARSGGPLDYATLNALDGDSDEDVAAPSPVSVQRPIQPATARERAAPPGAGRYACDSGPGAHAEATPSVGPDALSSAPTRARSRLGPTPQPPGAKLASPPRAAPWAAAPPAAAHAGGGVDDEGDAGAPAAPSSPMGGASSSSTREDHSAPHTPRGVRAAEPAAEPPFTSAPGTPAPPGAADGGSFSSRLSAAARSGAQSTSTPRRSGVRASLSPSPSARASAAPSPSAATRPSAEANKAAVERRGLEWRLKTATREHEKTERQLRERILALEGQVAARAELDEWRAEIRAGASPADLQLGPSQLAELVADIKAQERLISGYQAENEKLLRENKTLAAEAVRAKQQAAASTAAEPAPPGVRASVGDREHELNSLRLELDRAHATIQSLEAQLGGVDVGALQGECAHLRHALDAVTSQRHQLGSELQATQAKLAWYLENQSLLDEMADEIARRDERIRELESELSEPADGARPAVAAATDKVKALEAQVTMLTDLLQSEPPRAGSAGRGAAAGARGGKHARRGETLADLIRAAGPSPAHVQETRALQEQLEQSEAQRRAAESAHERRLRTLRQQHDRAKSQFEARIAELEQRSAAAGGGGRTRVRELESQLDEVRAFYSKKVRALEGSLASATRPVPAGAAGQQGQQAPWRGGGAAPRRARTAGGEGGGGSAAAAREQSGAPGLHAHDDGLGPEPGPPYRPRRAAPHPAAAAEAEQGGAQRGSSTALVTRTQPGGGAAAAAAEEELALTRAALADAHSKVDELRAEMAVVRTVGESGAAQAVQLICATLSRMAEQLGDEVGALGARVDAFAKREALAAGRQLPSSMQDVSARLVELEARHAAREELLQQTAERVRHAADVELFVTKQECANALRQKDLEIASFRAELDGLIHGLSALHHGGADRPDGATASLAHAGHSGQPAAG